MKNGLELSLLSSCTLSYVPYALVTLRTAKAHNPGLDLQLFVADGGAEAAAALKANSEFQSLSVNVFCPDDLSPALRGAYLSCFEYYNAFEVCNVAKYVGLQHVLNTRAPSCCIYADSDICFYGNVADIIGQQINAPILLTPHQFQPSSDAIESEFLLHGWINSGFSVFDGSDPRVMMALDWLIHRISCRGYLAPQFGLSGDQPWLSGLPFLFPELVQVCNAPGLNVAYWNLSERFLTGDGKGGFQCNGDKLLFFHFSGFVGAPAGLLSKHSDIAISKGSVLELLANIYVAELEHSEALRQELAAIPILPCCPDALQARMYKGGTAHRIYFDSPTIKRGFFSRAGMKLDSLISRWVR